MPGITSSSFIDIFRTEFITCLLDNVGEDGDDKVQLLTVINAVDIVTDQSILAVLHLTVVPLSEDVNLILFITGEIYERRQSSVATRCVKCRFDAIIQDAQVILDN
ncbi:hypothetical protein DERF_008156 [Dermatophagoides farinae]|uniref:Uncharacterized protein n=1 Tax=Dermatophagoides farinae TaxID=6954 RepID=A0A922L412_DERFA|nr:hypothetical protein DERF_008156 [Dermatophagoides farinae]